MVLRDKKTKITFHSGVLSIGGTVIEVRYENARIFFDFGTEYKPELNLKDDSLQTLLEYNLVPHLEGVYDPSLGYESTKEAGVETAVFLSHVHLDHTRMVNYLDKDIPLYALKETKILLDSLNANNDFILPLNNPMDAFTRDIIPCEHEEIVEVGSISVQLLRVDHDAYGACGLLINTPDLKIAYTGDLRLHGFDVQDTLSFMERAKGCDVLIMEGVTISFDEREDDEDTVLSEQALLDAFVSIQNENMDKPITFNAYPANIKRLVEIDKQSPRTVVFTESVAKILKETVGRDVHYYKEVGSNNSLDSRLEIRYDELLGDTHQYLWQIDKDYQNLKGGGVYIHSNAVPLGSFDPAYTPFIEALDENDIMFVELKCSGHAYPEDLDKIISGIQPKLLVPIHTLKPEKLENPYGRRYLPERGNTI